MRGGWKIRGCSLPRQSPAPECGEGLSPAKAQNPDLAPPADGSLQISGTERLCGIIHDSDTVGACEYSDFRHGLGPPEEVAYHDRGGALEGKLGEPLGVDATVRVDVDESHL